MNPYLSFLMGLGLGMGLQALITHTYFRQLARICDKQLDMMNRWVRERNIEEQINER